MTHTKEPWTWEEHELSTGYSAVVYDENGVAIDTHISAEKAKHIVECVNACAGLNPAAIPDVVEVLRKLHEAVDHMNASVEDGVNVQGAISNLIGCQETARDVLAALQVQS